MKNTCDIVRDLLPLYADKAASEASADMIADHLKTCPACVQYYKSIKKKTPVAPETNVLPIAKYDAFIKKAKRKDKSEKLLAFFSLFGIAAVCWYLIDRK